MDRIEFLKEIFAFFRRDIAKNENLLLSYDRALSTKESINWQRLYDITLREYDKTTLPPPSWFRGQFYRCYKEDNYNMHQNDGLKVIVTLNDGYKYDYELWHCTKSKNEIRQGLKRRFSYLTHDKEGNEIRATRVANIEFIKEESEDEQTGGSREVFA